MSNKIRIPHPHDRHIRKAWANVRRGYSICEASPEFMAKALEFTLKKIKSKVWHDILTGKYPEHTGYFKNIEDFFDLPEEEITFWEWHLQDHPFGAVLSEINYNELIKKRECKKRGGLSDKRLDCYYSRDKIHPDIIPLWKELKQLRIEGKIEFAYLFGSFAKGDIWRGSDIDLAVYINHKTDAEWIKVQDRILMSTDRDVDILRFDDEEENPFIAAEALEHGIPLVAIDDANRDVYYKVAVRIFNEVEDISSHDFAFGIAHFGKAASR